MGPQTFWRHPGGHAHFWPTNTKNQKMHDTYDFLCSSDRYRSPEFRDLFKFEIGWKMTEIWPKHVCPYMGVRVKLSLLWPISWPNIQIFHWNYIITKTITYYSFAFLWQFICQYIVNYGFYGPKTSKKVQNAPYLISTYFVNQHQ